MPRGLPREAWLLIAAIFIASPGLAIIAPVVAQIRDDLGLTNAAAGLVMSSFALARMVTDLPAGHLCDRFPKRAVVVSGMGLLLFGSLAAALSADLSQLLAGRVLMGVGSGLVQTATFAWMADLSSAANRGRMMSLSEAANVAQAATSPLIGGLVAAVGGWRATLAYCAAAALFSAALMLLVRESGERAPRSARQPRAARAAEPGLRLASPLGRPLLHLTGGMIAFNRNGVRNSLVPLFAATALGLGPTSIGLVVAVAGLCTIASNLIGGQLADRIDQSRVLAAGLALFVLGDLAFLASSSYAGLLLAAVVFGSGGLCASVPAAMLASAAPSGARGRALGNYRFVQDAGFSVGPIFVGWVYDGLGYEAALGLVCLSMALLVPACLRLLGLQPADRQTN